MKQTIGIIGLGLIGGSLARRLKRNGHRVYAVNRNEAPLKKAFREGVIDGYATALSDMELLGSCGIVFLCTPVDTIVDYAMRLAGVLSPGCIVTDVGSTKKKIWQDMAACPEVQCFIGGHPMAGSEKNGYEASTDYLFENAYYMLTPLPHVSDEKTEELTQLVRSLGAIPIRIGPEEHDHALAAISHAPHVIAAGLVNTVEALDSDNQMMHPLAAGGFRDITRIASSVPEMWSAISLENKDELIKILDVFQDHIRQFRNSLQLEEKTELLDFYSRAKKYRDSFANVAAGPVKAYEIRMDAEDKPGLIATVATMLSVNNINIKNIGIINSREYEGGILQIMFDNEESREKSIALLRQMNFALYD